MSDQTLTVERVLKGDPTVKKVDSGYTNNTAKENGYQIHIPFRGVFWVSDKDLSAARKAKAETPISLKP